jgi:23S rRNA pseudouridine1911/1915/1917 synthase
MNSNDELPEELDDNLFEHLRVDVPKGQELLRIDKFLMHFIANATRSKIQKRQKTETFM